jgi:hypothetical protein
MKLTKEQYEFKNDQITHQYPRYVTLDHVLVRLYLLLKHNGHSTMQRGGKAPKFTVERLAEFITSQEQIGTVQGFAENSHVVQEWIYSDLATITSRGRPDKEKYASPVPLHLEVPRLRMKDQVEDFGASRQLYAMMVHTDPSLPAELRQFLGEHDTTPDLYTLAILRMIESGGLEERPTSKSEEVYPPLCVGQARLMCDDVRRLLAYAHSLPRAVFIEHLKMLFGLHLGLYGLRIANQLPGWVSEKRANHTCKACPVHPNSPDPFAPCPFACQSRTAASFVMPAILVDMGDDFKSHMARLAIASYNAHFARLTDYVRAVLTVNQALRAGKVSKIQRRLNYEVIGIDEALRLMAAPPESFDDFFDDQIDSIFPEGLDDEPRDVQAIFNERELSPFDRYIELIALNRTNYYQKYLRDQIDTTLMKNTDSGLLMQGKGARNTRRWHLGSRLLELLAHLALIEPDDAGIYRSRTMLIDQFTEWLRARYGIVFRSDDSNASIEDIAAFNENQRLLRQCLREIGMYIDLSDAYNTQRLHPRYRIG